MAKTNYSYEKRQGELKKQKKREEKLKKKKEKKLNIDSDGMDANPENHDDNNEDVVSNPSVD
ncbi:MAG: hypothetical protein PF518_12845 [Spirochaetaceae bacterium]|jgi:hypothetical protein|nr:hypothetical protein [Spirochaetaceae bacterium]